MCFFIRLFSKQNNEPRIFKKRLKLKSNYCLLNNHLIQKESLCTSFNATNVLLKPKQAFIASCRPARFELIQYLFFKKILKKIIKKPRIFNIFSKKNIWIFWKPNYPLTKKSKNSRMGKGKGMFLRWSVRVPAYFKFFIFFFYFSNLILNKAIQKLAYKIKPSCFYKIY